MQTGDKSLGLPGQEETLFTFDFPLGTGLPAPGLARLCQPLLFSEAEAHLPPSPVGPSALLCKQDPRQAAGPCTGNETAFRSPATSSSHPETLQSSNEGSWEGARRSWGFAHYGIHQPWWKINRQMKKRTLRQLSKPSINDTSSGKPPHPGSSPYCSSQFSYIQ